MERHVIRVDCTTLRGRIARLIADDFFTKAQIRGVEDMWFVPEHRASMATQSQLSRRGGEW